LPEDFTVTDYDIHVISSTQIMQDMQHIQVLVPEFIKSGQLPPDILFEVMTSKSLSEMKYKVKKALRIQKEENNQLMQLQQKLEETTQQAQQLQQQLQQAQQQLKQVDEQRLKLEMDKMNLEYKVDWFKAQTEKAYKERQLDIEEKKVDIELYQLRDGNPYNNQIRMR
jgi:septal ring factor EnvC (AmiA/AmiB activator)